MDKIHVVIALEAVFPESKGGIERWYLYLAEKLSRHGLRVTYLNMQGITEIRNGVSYISLFDETWKYAGAGKRTILQSFKYGVRMSRWLSENSFDVAYISSVPVIHLNILSLNSKIRKGRIYVEWFEYWSLSYWVKYSGVIFGTVGWFSQYFALKVGYKKVTFTKRITNKITKLQSLNSVIQLPGLAPIYEESPRNFKVLDTRNDICFLGRLVSEKQPIEAVKFVNEYIQNFGWSGNFWIIGTGPLENEIRKLIGDLDLQSQVHLLIGAEDKIVEEKLNSSFVLLHPSKREGYGLAMFEAAKFCTPTILINYKENASVDLTPISELVCISDSPREVLSAIENARVNQSMYKGKLVIFKKNTFSISMRKSADNLAEEFLKT